MGFTLAELLVVISIMTIILTTYLWNLTAFNQELAIGRLAQQMALTFRDAESRAMAVRTDVYADPRSFPTGYGLYFDTSDPQRYILFVDRSTSGRVGLYDPDQNEKVATFDLGAFVRISDLQKNPAGAPVAINSSLTVVFRRPIPAVEARVDGSSGISPENNFGVVLTSANGAYKRTIQIWTTGQISLQ